jgi:hypothetical protein
MTAANKDAFAALMAEIRDLRDEGWTCVEVKAELYPQDYASHGFLLTNDDMEIRIQLP